MRTLLAVAVGIVGVLVGYLPGTLIASVYNLLGAWITGGPSTTTWHGCNDCAKLYNTAVWYWIPQLVRGFVAGTVGLWLAHLVFKKVQASVIVPGVVCSYVVIGSVLAVISYRAGGSMAELVGLGVNVIGIAVGSIVVGNAARDDA